jgi:hypothetical protein
MVKDYQDGKIYTLRSHHTEDIYIGSTIQSLSCRKSKHKTDYKLFLDGKAKAKSSSKMMKYDDVYIELLELFPCNSRMELEKREGELMRIHLNKIVNKNIAGRTRDELLLTDKYKNYWKSPEYKAYLKEYYSTPQYKSYEATLERKTYHKAYQKEYYLKRKQAKLINVNNATSIIPVNNISSNINIQESIIIPTTSTIPDIDSLIIDIE